VSRDLQAFAMPRPRTFDNVPVTKEVAMLPLEASEQLVECRLVQGVAVLDACGEIDVHSCYRLRDRMLAIIDADQRDLVLNLDAVSFIDSAGIGVLVGVWHRLQAVDGVLALAAPSRQVRTIFNVIGMAEVFSIHETVTEAVQACRQAGAVSRGA
jgi:anti-sigma B factor antagonist